MPSQFSSNPLQTSGMPGLMLTLLSWQSPSQSVHPSPSLSSSWGSSTPLQSLSRYPSQVSVAPGLTATVKSLQSPRQME